MLTGPVASRSECRFCAARRCRSADFSLCAGCGEEEAPKNQGEVTVKMAADVQPVPPSKEKRQGSTGTGVNHQPERCQASTEGQTSSIRRSNTSVFVGPVGLEPTTYGVPVRRAAVRTFGPVSCLVTAAWLWLFGSRKQPSCPARCPSRVVPGCCPAGVATDALVAGAEPIVLVGRLDGVRLDGGQVPWGGVRR
jgi:hypothetical protein